VLWRVALLEALDQPPGFDGRTGQTADSTVLAASCLPILDAELSAPAPDQEAVEYCPSVKDYPRRDLFEALMADEEGHVDFLETQTRKSVGIQCLHRQHEAGDIGTKHLIGARASTDRDPVRFRTHNEH
jgi:hypothetical protein